MKHWIFNQHTEQCKCDSEKYKLNEDTRYFANHCDRNKEHILFFHLADYYIITLGSCWLHLDRYVTIVEILKKVGLKVKLKTNFNRDYHLDERLQKARKQNILFNNEVIEVNYTYGGFGKQYSITSTLDLFDCIDKYSEYKSNYQNMVKYLNDNGMEHLQDRLRLLYENNWLVMPSKVEVVKTLDNIIKQINTHGNN